MEEVLKYVLGIIILVLGVPIGNFLAKYTEEELEVGQRWFKIILLVSLVCGLFFAFTKQDALMFGFLFVAVVTSRSLR